MTEGRIALSSGEGEERSSLVPPATKTLNFKVTTEFKKEFKRFSVGQEMTMVEPLKESFELSKRK